MTSPRTSRSIALVAIFPILGCTATGCSSNAGDPTGDSADAVTVARKHPFDVGMNEWTGEFGPYAAFRKAASASGPRLCHVYTYWNIAREDPPNGDQTHRLAGLVQWMSKAEASCDEVLVTFQGRQDEQWHESPPLATTLEQAFTEFLHLTERGQSLERWRGKLSFTPWNEPNNPAGSGNGLFEEITPERAARYYMAIRKHCSPEHGCKVAAGDFATDGSTADSIEWNCGDDNSPHDTTTRCAQPSSFGSGKPPSYLDRYKNEIAIHAGDFGLPAGFRPEYFAYHPWHDVNGYLESHKPCSRYEDCVTRRLLRSLGGSWSGVEIWDTEIGVGLQTNPAPTEKRQACAAAFLVQLTDLSPRITRLYYMTFAGGNGPLFEGSTLRPAGHVLATGSLTYAHDCAPTGML